MIRCLVICLDRLKYSLYLQAVFMILSCQQKLASHALHLNILAFAGMT